MKQTQYTCDECGKTTTGGVDGWWMGLASVESCSLTILKSTRDAGASANINHLCSTGCANQWNDKQVERIMAGAVAGRMTGEAEKGAAESDEHAQLQVLKNILANQASVRGKPMTMENVVDVSGLFGDLKGLGKTG